MHSSNPIDVFLKFVCFVHQAVDSRPTTGVDVEYDPTTMQAKYTGKQFLHDRDKKAAAEEGKKGWKVARGHDGRMYYINMETGETTWDDPTAGGEEERRLKLTNDLTAELDTNLGQEEAVRALGNEYTREADAAQAERDAEDAAQAALDADALKGKTRTKKTRTKVQNIGKAIGKNRRVDVEGKRAGVW